MQGKNSKMRKNYIYMEKKQNSPSIKTEGETGVLLKTKTKIPSMYRVLLLNDDFTPMDFVVYILEKYFNKNSQEATEIMMNVHNNGIGLCGIYTYEIAETKVALVVDDARKSEYPLQCVMEKE